MIEVKFYGGVAIPRRETIIEFIDPPPPTLAERAGDVFWGIVEALELPVMMMILGAAQGAGIGLVVGLLLGDIRS